MPQKKLPSVRYSFREPSDRPITIDVSAAELLELASAHRRSAARLDRKLAGQIRACKTQRDLKAIAEVAKEWFEAHQERADHLIELAKKNL